MLVVSHLSRLGRRTADILALAKAAETEGWHIAILDMQVDTTTGRGQWTAAEVNRAIHTAQLDAQAATPTNQ